MNTHCGERKKVAEEGERNLKRAKIASELNSIYIHFIVTFDLISNL